MDPLAHRVASEYRKRIVADQPPGQRKKVRDLSQPINKPRGINREVVKEFATSVDGDSVVKPDRKDIQPKDVFSPTPRNVGVLNYAETGKDLTRAIQQMPKDKGYDTVSNLSQYLIETQGGGGTESEGRR